MSSLDDIANGLQGFVDSIKAASSCSRAVEKVLELNDTVKTLCNDANKQDTTDGDFLEYKSQLNTSGRILDDLELPGRDIKVGAKQLESLLRGVIKNEQLSPADYSELRKLLNNLMETGSTFSNGIHAFQVAIQKLRSFCERALKKQEQEAKKLQDAASSKRWTGIGGGAGLVSLGAGAVALGIAGVLTGRTAFVVAGVAGAAAGAAGVAGGVRVAAAGVLSARDIDQNAQGFLRSAESLKVARAGVQRLEQNLKQGALKLTDEMLKLLKVGLNLFDTMEKDAKEKQQLKDENAELRRQVEELKLSAGLKKSDD